MRALKRFDQPEILEKKKEEWTKKFIESAKPRPHNSKYGHKQIQSALYTMSNSKCFYCEKKLKGIPKEIDHFIEVAENKKLAFEWENLYLACDNCNDKIPNKSIKVENALDPCSATDEEIRQHITFKDEEIIPFKGSIIGSNTIKKYKLDSMQLDYLRGKQLKEFYKALVRMKDKINIEGRSNFNEDEIEFFREFTYPHNHYSQMFHNLFATLIE